MNEQIAKILPMLPSDVSRSICFAEKEIIDNICEIRLVKNGFVALSVMGRTVFLDRSGETTSMPETSTLKTTEKELNDCFMLLCGNSVYAHERELKEGFLSLPCGCRAGVCGSFFCDRVSEVFSLNIRISHEIIGCADCLLESFNGGLLIAGAPLSGKTTVLRDLIKSISNGKTGKYLRVCAVDSRKEITVGFDMGCCTDTVLTEDKAKGVEIALRTMSPNIIAFDEIGTSGELSAVRELFNAGVTVITTVHASSIDDILSRPVIKELLNTGAIKNIALLSEKIGEAPSIFSYKEIMKIA